MPSKPSPLTNTTLIIRVIFVLYAVALLLAIHWPGVAVKSSFSRLDLVIHACVFCLWTVLLGLTGWVQSPRGLSRKTSKLVLIGVVYGCIEEITQPLSTRTFDTLDLAANTTGVILGGITLLVVWTRSATRFRASSSDSLAHQPPDTRS